MKKILFLIGMIAISSACYAALYVGEKEDGSVVVLNYFDNAEDSLKQVAIEQNIKGGSLIPIDKDSIPSEEIKYWKIKNGKITINDQKKQNDDQEKAIKRESHRQEKNAVLEKLKITEEEFKTLIKDEQ